MKNLKFLILPLLVLCLFANSCSSDDNSNDNVDTIVGTWKVTDVWQNGVSVYILLQMVAPCPLKNKYILANDYSMKVETFETVGETNECTPGETQNGNWSKDGSTYYVSFEGQTTNTEVEFLDNNNFTTIIEVEGEQAKVKLTRQ
jgi:hypothetical protein